VENSRCGLYIHIPFCRKRCRYCDYVSFESRETEMPAYVRALCREMILRGAGLSRPLTSVYIGGGSPGLLGPAGIEFLMTACRENFTLAQDVEVTVESHPETTTPEFVEAALGSGVNRLSLGIIALNDYILELLGRSHDADAARRSYLVASGLGFRNISVELLYGLPAQTDEDCLRGVREVAGWKPAHVSLSELTVVPGTPLHREYRDGAVALVSEDMAAEMYDEAATLLEALDWERYEISSFARDGLRCRHHLTYWENGSYLGLGVGALSSLDGWRLRNTTRLSEYLRILGGDHPRETAVKERVPVSPAREADDALILGLRTTDGVDITDFDRRYGGSLLADRREPIENLHRAGLLVVANGRLQLSPKGLMFSSHVFRQFLSAG
jgi:oxygen-independent coproporphyrinogen-3 oxidase